MTHPIQTSASWGLTGETAALLEAVTHNWLIGIRETNPAILDMFRDRDKLPVRDLLSWSGEFAGKYLTGAYYVYRITHDPALYAYVREFLDEFITYIDPEDGYWGCYPRDCRLTGKNPYHHPPEDYQSCTWDAWSHYHGMMGTYLWYKETGDPRYLAAVEKGAGCFIRYFYNGGRRLMEMGELFVNLSPLHIFALLYQETGKPEYLAFCREVERDVATPGAGEYMRYAEEGREFYQCPQPRWESVHTLLGLNALGKAVGDDSYLRAVERLFYSILKTDVHNTGAFSTDEQAVGNPFAVGRVELCCVIAYNALAAEILQQTGDSRVADFLEISFYNAVMGSFSPTGRWSTYNTPMEGHKNANYHDINFQCRPGSPDLNCCSANAARGLGTYAAWAVLEDDSTVYINSYEAMKLDAASGWQLQVMGHYPAEGQVTLQARGLGGRRLALRIPAWSKQTTVWVDGICHTPAPGGYCMLEEAEGKSVTLYLDFAPSFLEGQGAFAGRSTVYYGPILYGYDASLNGGYPLDGLPEARREELAKKRPVRTADGRLTVTLDNGLILSDFYRMGSTGCDYTTWVPVVD